MYILHNKNQLLLRNKFEFWHKHWNTFFRQNLYIFQRILTFFTTARYFPERLADEKFLEKERMRNSILGLSTDSFCTCSKKFQFQIFTCILISLRFRASDLFI